MMSTCFRSLALGVAVISFASCGSSSKLKVSKESVPAVLWPVSQTNVVDGRGRFREIYSDVRREHLNEFEYDRAVDEALIKFSKEPGPTGGDIHLGQARLSIRILVVPGIFGECIVDKVSPFFYALQHIETHGYKTGLIQVSGLSSTTHNAKQIREAIIGMDHPPDEKLVLIGYSKGAPDILEALVNHPEIVDRVAAVVSVAGVVCGSPLADEVSKPFLKLIGKLSLPGCPRGDEKGVQSITRATRLKWLAENKLPESVQYFSLACFNNSDGISSILRGNYKKLSEIDPRNDSQALITDTIIPGSTLLGYAKADHWAVTLPFSRNLPILSSLIDQNDFPREVLLESIVRFIEEDLLAN